MFALFHIFLGLYDSSSFFYVVLLIPTFVSLVLMILLFSTLCIHVDSEERETIFHFLSFNFLFFALYLEQILSSICYMNAILRHLTAPMQHYSVLLFFFSFFWVICLQMLRGALCSCL